MLKVTALIVCLALIGSVMSEELADSVIEARAESIASWAGERLADFGDLQGKFAVKSIASRQVEKTENAYAFKMDVEFVAEDGSTKMCNMNVMDNAQLNTRIFNNRMSCF